MWFHSFFPTEIGILKLFLVTQMWCILPSVVSAARRRCPHAIFSLYVTRLRCDKPYSDLLYITLECSRTFLNRPMRTVILSYRHTIGVGPYPYGFALFGHDVIH